LQARRKKLGPVRVAFEDKKSTLIWIAGAKENNSDLDQELELNQL